MRGTIVKMGLGAVAAAAMIALAGCESGKDVAYEDASIHDAKFEEAVNTRCTYTGYDVNPRYNVTYKGATIGFCSKKTHDLFLDGDDAERDRVLEEALAQN